MPEIIAADEHTLSFEFAEISFINGISDDDVLFPETRVEFGE